MLRAAGSDDENAARLGADPKPAAGVLINQVHCASVGAWQQGLLRADDASIDEVETLIVADPDSSLLDPRASP